MSLRSYRWGMAASLTNALQEIAMQYKKKADVEVVSSFASSSTLARQIEQGAPADLYYLSGSAADG